MAEFISSETVSVNDYDKIVYKIKSSVDIGTAVMFKADGTYLVNVKDGEIIVERIG